MARARSLAGVNEARPGNYALCDHTQVVLGSCEVRDCAVTVMASVVSSQPGASHCVIDAGALALSKDLGMDSPAHFGHVFDEYADARLHPDLRVASVSQEHGVLDHPLPPGARVRILPNHACLAVAQFDRFHVVRGDQVVAVWKIWRDR
jgi:D-serine deaminase-like pyridoxal phosphate-dependent protein